MKKFSFISVRNLVRCLPVISMAYLISFTCFSQGQTKQRESKDESLKYLKTFKVRNVQAVNVNAVSQVDEYAYILNKGVKYTLTTLSEENKESKVIVQLFDRNHKFIATNFDEKSKKYFKALNYVCSATGIYYMTFNCQDKNGTCPEGILKFKN